MPIASPSQALKRLGLNVHTLLLLGMVGLASVMPARGDFSVVLSAIGWWVIALVFFLYGARLATGTVIAGLTSWRLQLSCLMASFVVAPLACLLVAPVAGRFLPSEIMTGILFLGCLPSTVNSCVTLTSIARGNVAGAICAASLSNLLGVIVTPLMLILLIPGGWSFAVDPSAIAKIAEQVLLPFVLGQLARPLLVRVLARMGDVVQLFDRSAILLIVYSAFSAGVTNGIWQRVPLADLLILGLACVAVLALIMLASHPLGRLFGLGHADGIALFYVGSTKSLATGLPIAGALFAREDISLVVLPIMFFHLLQLLVCAPINQMHERRTASPQGNPFGSQT